MHKADKAMPCAFLWNRREKKRIFEMDKCMIGTIWVEMWRKYDIIYKKWESEKERPGSKRVR